MLQKAITPLAPRWSPGRINYELTGPVRLEVECACRVPGCLLIGEIRPGRSNFALSYRRRLTRFPIRDCRIDTWRARARPRRRLKRVMSLTRCRRADSLAPPRLPGAPGPPQRSEVTATECRAGR